MRRIAVLTFGLLLLQAVPASAAPDVVRQGTCRFAQPAQPRTRSHLELTDMGDRIKVRFEVHQAPVGHEWRIHFRHLHTWIPFPSPDRGRVFFEGTRVASDSGFLVVQRGVVDQEEIDGLVGRAVDRQTGQVCRAWAWIE